MESEMLQDARDAITKCDLWDWLKTYTPEDGKGFMFTSHPNLDRISAAMKYTGHSGASYGFTMRKMEQEAKSKITPLDIAKECQDKPGFEGQYDAMKRFSEGKMTYAEMRSLCG